MNLVLNSTDEINKFINDFFNLSENELIDLFNLKTTNTIKKREGVFVLPSGNMISVSDIGDESTHEDFIYDLFDELSYKVVADTDVQCALIDTLYDWISIDDFILRFKWCRLRMGYMDATCADMTLPTSITNNQLYRIDDFIESAYDFGIKSIRVLILESSNQVNGKDYSFEDYFPSDISKKIRRYFSSGTFYENSGSNKYIQHKMHKYISEGLADFRKRYSNIDDDTFNEIVALDPTTNIEKDKKGLYCDWLLRLYKNNKLDLNRKSHITDVLSLFDTNKKKLKNKDINSYKSLEELENAIIDETNQAEVSANREIKNKRKADITKDADKVYEDNNWVVYIPKTYEASCTLGSGTEWCTADSRTDKFYNKYTKRGNLYILINKKDKSDKYQFHFETESFMDKNDNDIDLLDFFAADENIALYEFFRTKFNKAQKAELEILDSYNDQLVANIRKSGVLHYDTTISNDIIKIAKPTIVIIDDSVTSIGDNAFYNCISLTSITIPNSVTSIGDNVFANCISLTSITIPDSVKSTGNSAFYNCTSLTSITIGNSVTSIGKSAFANCKSLKTITIPESVTSICEDAFMNCKKLTITCSKNSYAYKYAQANNIPIKLVNESYNKLHIKESNNMSDEYELLIPISIDTDNKKYNISKLNDIVGNELYDKIEDVSKTIINDISKKLNVDFEFDTIEEHKHNYADMKYIVATFEYDGDINTLESEIDNAVSDMEFFESIEVELAVPFSNDTKSLSISLDIAPISDCIINKLN